VGARLCSIIVSIVDHVYSESRRNPMEAIMRSFQAMGPGTLRRDGISRRDVLRVGGLSALGLGLPQLMNPLRTIAAGVPHSDSGAKARSCIVLFLSGGPPQHST